MHSHYKQPTKTSWALLVQHKWVAKNPARCAHVVGDPRGQKWSELAAPPQPLKSLRAMHLAWKRHTERHTQCFAGVLVRPAAEVFWWWSERHPKRHPNDIWTTSVLLQTDQLTTWCRKSSVFSFFPWCNKQKNVGPRGTPDFSRHSSTSKDCGMLLRIRLLLTTVQILTVIPVQTTDNETAAWNCDG